MIFVAGSHSFASLCGNCSSSTTWYLGIRPCARFRT